MNSPIHHLNKDFENRYRLGIMSLLMVQASVDFLDFKARLRGGDDSPLTDGNLAAHLGHLEKRGYLSVHKSFAGRKPRTSYQISEAGRQAFAAHLDALEQLLRGLP